MKIKPLSKLLTAAHYWLIFPCVKSLLEIEAAIAKLPAKARRQLVQDIPALCPGEFPAEGWDAILNDATRRPALSSLLDSLDAKLLTTGPN